MPAGSAEPNIYRTGMIFSQPNAQQAPPQPAAGNDSAHSMNPARRFPRCSAEELAAMSDTRPMTPEQAATLKQLAKAAYELDAFKPNLTRAEADLRIAMLTAKLKLLDGPPHTL